MGGYMSTRIWIVIINLIFIVPALAFDQPHINAKLINTFINTSGHFIDNGNVYKITIPRNDLKVTINNVKLTPAMGLASSISFKKEKNNVFVNGNVAITEDQVNPVLLTALQNNLLVTALHHHFLWEYPRVVFMHLEGHGKEVAMAKAVGAVLASLKNTSNGKGAVPYAEIDPDTTSLNSHLIDKILGEKGKLKKGVYTVSLDQVRMDGYPDQHLHTARAWAEFVGSNEAAAVYGNFIIHEAALQNVIKTFDRAQITVVALHQHTTNQQQRYLFIRYLGVGKTRDLANALRTATNLSRKTNLKVASMLNISNMCLIGKKLPTAVVTRKIAPMAKIKKAQNRINVSLIQNELAKHLLFASTKKARHAKFFLFSAYSQSYLR